MIGKLSTASAAAAMVLASPAMAETVGYWTGTLTLTEQLKLRTGVTIERAADGTLSGTFDSPDQNAFGIPLADIELTEARLAFKVPAISGSYEATWDAAAQAWNGTFSQMGNGVPLVLTAGDLASKPGPKPLPAAWDIPSSDTLGAALEERIALRPGAGMVLGVLEPAGTRIVARGPAGGPAFDAAPSGRRT